MVQTSVTGLSCAFAAWLYTTSHTSFHIQTPCFLNKRLKLTKAYAYLHDLKEHKQVIPFRLFFITVRHASQAKHFNVTEAIHFIAGSRSLSSSCFVSSNILIRYHATVREHATNIPRNPVIDVICFLFVSLSAQLSCDGE
jgi:hypothetical protein